MTFSSEESEFVLLANLSPREAEVARLVSEGQPLKAIASELRRKDGGPLHLSTVKVYVARAKRKLGANTVTHLAVLYVASGPNRQG